MTMMKKVCVAIMELFGGLKNILPEHMAQWVLSHVPSQTDSFLNKATDAAVISHLRISNTRELKEI